MIFHKADMFWVLSAFSLHLIIYPVYSSTNVTESALLNRTESDTSADKHNTTFEKHETLRSCITSTFDEGEYILFENRTLFIKYYNLTLNESLYIRDESSVRICKLSTEKKKVTKNSILVISYLMIIGVGISMICLFMHLVVFSIVPGLRNLPGWNLAALCASLFISYLLLFIISSDPVSSSRNICICSASLTHFFLLASFLWMSVMSLDVFMSIVRATGSLQISSTQFKLKKFGINSLCVFGVALVFAVLGLLVDVLDIVPQDYRPMFEKQCWFSQKKPLLVFFAGPVIALICLNFIFFGLSTYVLHANKIRSNKDDHHTTLCRNYLMYFRLSVIMGITWIAGVAALIAKAGWMWKVFVLLNSLHGLYIFLAFTCSNKVKKYFKESLLQSGRANKQTVGETFQSCCLCPNSNGKNLDKLVENKDEKDETTITHL